MAYQIESLKVVAKKEIVEGMRVSRIIAKKGQIGNKTMESQGVVVPVVAVNVVNTLLSDDTGREFLCNAVAGVQDGIIRKLVENGKMAFFDEQIGISALIDAMRVENETSRFSKDGIAKWFDAVMVPVLREKIVEKYAGIAESKIADMLRGYLQSFQILAGRTPSMPNKVKAGLVRALEFLPQDTDDAMTLEIGTRLAAVSEAAVMLDML